jgi:hypothetical protein
MTPVSPSNGSNSGRMARRRQPVVHRSPDLSALDRWLARPMMAGDQEHHSLASSDCPIEDMIDRVPGAIQGHAVKVQDSVRFDVAGPELLVPTAIERSRMMLRVRRLSPGDRAH